MSMTTKITCGGLTQAVARRRLWPGCVVRSNAVARMCGQKQRKELWPAAVARSRLWPRAGCGQDVWSEVTQRAVARSRLWPGAGCGPEQAVARTHGQKQGKDAENELPGQYQTDDSHPGLGFNNI